MMSPLPALHHILLVCVFSTSWLSNHVHAESQTPAVTIAGADFLKDAQAAILAEKIASVFTVYSLTYYQHDNPALIARTYRVEEWMTPDKYRADIVEEQLANGVATVTRQDTLVTARGKNYAFDRLKNAMSVNPGQTPVCAEFSHPLLFKHALIKRLLSNYDANCSLLSIHSGQYFDRVGALVQVTQKNPYEISVMENNNPENLQQYVLRFTPDQPNLPESIEIWDKPTVSDAAPDATSTSDYQRTQVFTIINRDRVRLADGSELTYPKKITWHDGSGTHLRCVIAVELLDINTPLEDDLFKLEKEARALLR
jgi:hypothetical protein